MKKTFVLVSLISLLSVTGISASSAMYRTEVGNVFWEDARVTMSSDYQYRTHYEGMSNANKAINIEVESAFEHQSALCYRNARTVYITGYGGMEHTHSHWIDNEYTPYKLINKN